MIRSVVSLSCERERNCQRTRQIEVTITFFGLLDVNRDERESELYLKVLNAFHKAINICLNDPLYGIPVLREARSGFHSFVSLFNFTRTLGS